MAVSPKDVVKKLTDEDLASVKEIEEAVDEKLKKDGQITDLDMYDITCDDGTYFPDHIWEAVVENYRKTGWNVFVQGRNIKILK